MTDRLRSRRYDVIGKDVECASALLFVQIFFSLLGFAGPGETRGRVRAGWDRVGSFCLYNGLVRDYLDSSFFSSSFSFSSESA